MRKEWYGNALKVHRFDVFHFDDCDRLVVEVDEAARLRVGRGRRGGVATVGYISTRALRGAPSNDFSAKGMSMSKILPSSG